MNKRISKGTLTGHVADQLGLAKTTTDGVIAAFLAAVQDAAMNGLDVQLAGFGTFMRRDRPERMGRNPATGLQIPLAPSSTLAFRASKAAPGSK